MMVSSYAKATTADPDKPGLVRRGSSKSELGEEPNTSAAEAVLDSQLIATSLVAVLHIGESVIVKVEVQAVFREEILAARRLRSVVSWWCVCCVWACTRSCRVAFLAYVFFDQIGGLHFVVDLKCKFPCFRRTHARVCACLRSSDRSLFRLLCPARDWQRAIVQRVLRGCVVVEGKTVGSIGKGAVVLLGLHKVGV